MGKVVVEGILSSTTPTAADGGIALSRRSIERAAEEIREEGLRLTLDHDPLRRLHPEVRKVELREIEGGGLALWVQFLLDEDEWSQVGDRRGFSATGIVAALAAERSESKPAVEIFADAAQFEKEQYDAAVVELRRHFNVGGGRLIQLSEVPPPAVILELAWNGLQSLALGVAGSAIYDGLKHLLRPKHAPESAFYLKVRRGDHVTSAHLRTSDHEVLKEALSTWRDVVLANPEVNDIEYTTTEHGWQTISQKQPTLRSARPDTRRTGSGRPAHKHAKDRGRRPRRKRPR